MTDDTEAWKRVAVAAALPLEVMRMSRAYYALSSDLQTSVDEAVVTIRLALDGHLPPAGHIDEILEPARQVLLAARGEP